MSALGDALAASLGASQELESDYGFDGQVDELVHQHGVTGTARLLGVARTTVQRWRSGTTRTPKPATTQRVARAFREDTIPKVQDRQWFLSTVANDGRHGAPRVRTLDAQRLGMAPGAIERARQAYIDTGSKEAAAKTLWKEIRVPFYKDYLYDDEFDVQYEGEDLDADYHAQSVTVHR